MNITRHGDNLIQLTRLLSMNCFLVREDDGFTLVDTNLPGSARGILKAAEDVGLPITRIALTHAHTDHVGSVDSLHKQLRAVPVTISARDARFLLGDFTLDPDEPDVELRGSFTTLKTRPSHFLAEGELVGSLRVISSPGHTPGHVAFLDVRDNTLICGDAFQTRDGVAVAGTLRPLFPLPALATWHQPTAFESALRLRELRPSRLAPGHGPVIDDPLPQMDAALSLAQREVYKH